MQFSIMNRIITIRVRKKQKYNKIGVNNNIIGTGNYVVFLDYDEQDYNEVKKRVKSIQEEHDLGTAYVYKTTHGFHAYIPNVVTQKELIKILVDAKEDFKHSLAMFWKEKEPAHTLRINPLTDDDIVFHDKIIRRSSKPVSKAHLLFLKNVLNAPVEVENNLINSRKVDVVFYAQEKKE